MRPSSLLDHDALRRCCLDCEGALKVIRPALLQFLEDVRDLRPEALEPLSLEELLRRYWLLDEIVHLPIGERLSEMILEDPEVSTHLPTVRACYRSFLLWAERKLADRVLRSRKPWEAFRGFPLLGRYHTLMEAYFDVVPLTEGETLAFVGAGPVPFSLILAAQRGVKGLGVDVDPEAVSTARGVLRRLGLEGVVEVVEGDEGALEGRSWDAVLVAALAEPKGRIFRRLLRVLKEVCPPHPLCLRTYTGMRALLYEPVKGEDLRGFKVVGELKPPGRVNNTLVFAVPDEP